MADHPILFSAPMVRALIAGTKTQTRRMLSLPTKTASGGCIYERPDMGGWEATTVGGAGCTLRDGTPAPEMVAIWHRTTGVCMTTPIQPGDQLWVREEWKTSALYDHIPPRELPRSAPIYYTAHDRLAPVARYRASMHMPRWASRLTLIVTDVRVQRLQDISEEDARAEGLQWVSPTYGVAGVPESWNADPRRSYAALWDSINGPGGWGANPWVTAYTFEVHHQNISAMPEAIDG